MRRCPPWLSANADGPQGAQWEGPEQQQSPLQWPLGMDDVFSKKAAPCCWESLAMEPTPADIPACPSSARPCALAMVGSPRRTTSISARIDSQPRTSIRFPMLFLQLAAYCANLKGQSLQDSPPRLNVVAAQRLTPQSEHPISEYARSWQPFLGTPPNRAMRFAHGGCGWGFTPVDRAFRRVIERCPKKPGKLGFLRRLERSAACQGQIRTPPASAFTTRPRRSMPMMRRS